MQTNGIRPIGGVEISDDLHHKRQITIPHPRQRKIIVKQNEIDESG
jgi:hypothetical protein